MARTTTNVNLAFRAEDKATPVIKKVSDSVGRMPEKLGKSAAALNTMSVASGRAGGAMADLGAKLSDVAAIALSGGPFGVAIAAATAAVAAGAEVWDVYSESTEAAESALRSLDPVLAKARERLEAQKKSTDDMIFALENWGKTSTEVQLAKTEAMIQAQDEAIPRIYDEIAATREKIVVMLEEAKALRSKHTFSNRADQEAADALEKKASLEDQLADKLQENLDAAKLARMENMRRAGVLIETIEKQKRDNDEAERSAKIARRRAAAEKSAQAEKVAAAKANEAAEKRMEERAKDREATLAGIHEANALRRVTIEGEKQMAIEAMRNEAELRETERIQRQAQQSIATTQMIGGITSNMFVNMANDSRNAGKHMANAALDTAGAIINAAAAKAAAEAASSQAGIPVIGPILAATAASTVFALVKAYIARMESGGVLMGGTLGRDSALFYGQQGERVLSVRQNVLFERMIERLDEIAKFGGGGPGVGGDGGGRTVVQNFNSLMPQMSAEHVRAARELKRVMR